ncbi:MAG: MFS transporter, partial [Corynebacterium sp.]|nr:MFS transporter [Corynebacterium sp.]
VPFLLSFVLVIVGYLVRIGVDESPVFKVIAGNKSHEGPNPIGVLFKQHLPLVFVAALVFAGNGAVGYMTAGGYIQNYATNPEGPISFERGDVLNAVTLSAVTWLIFTLFAGWVSDYIGRRRTYLIGFVVQAIGAGILFPLVNSASLGLLYVALIFLTVGLGLTYGAQSAMYAELYPASVRASGVSISYAIGSILGGAFAPMIAASLVDATGTTVAVTIYLVTASLVGFTAILLLQERKGIPLSPDFETEQSKSPFIFGK